MTMLSERPSAEPAEDRPPPPAPVRRMRTPFAGPAQPRGPRPTPRPMTSVEETASLASSAFTMVAIVCLWMVAQMLFLGGLSQNRSQELLYDQFRRDLSGLVAPVGPTVPVGQPVALIQAPAIGLQQVVVEGTASGDLLVGPGHRRDTVLPGQEGVSLVYGRGTTYAAPFAHITDLEPGDPISVVVGQGRLEFSVLGVRRAGDPVPTPPPAGVARLTLVTAEGTGRLARITAGKAVYVDAEAKKAFPAPAGRPVAVPESEKAMANDPGGLPLVALCLAGLVALTLGVIAARQRWSTALVWVVASPVAVALSWATTDVVMRLLPNLI